uniref:Uncharacterized protein n=1 Tax=Lupinus angustifolius TaxID=3871 RepID=L0P0W5_LUPAN|nr:hypothetical protein [Lupinus angustifolius]
MERHDDRNINWIWIGAAIMVIRQEVLNDCLVERNPETDWAYHVSTSDRAALWIFIDGNIDKKNLTDV